jgi:uncharacterized protein with ATP-grasp and redox domains
LKALEELKIHDASLAELLAVAALANSVDAWMPWVGEAGLSLAGGVEGDPAAASELIASSTSLAYLLDNAGEAAIDLAVACTLASNGLEVAVVAKSEPYEVDATVDEVRLLLAHIARRIDCPRLRVEATGSRYPAPAAPYVSRRVVELLASSDVVLSKGVANLEALMEFETVERERVVVALRVKCPVLARLLDASLGSAYVGVGYP